MIRHSLGRCLALAAGLMTATAVPRAQAPGQASSDLIGRVLFSELAVPGVVVTAIRPADAGRNVTERRVATMTDDEGFFRFANLDDGVWSLRVEMRGFVTMNRDVTVPFKEDALSFTLAMRSFDEIASSPAPAFVPTPVQGEGKPSAAQSDDPDIITGSSINGAASVFAQSRAFGNNRPRQTARYTGGVSAVLGSSAWNARPYSFAGSTAAEPSYGDVQLGFTLGGPLKIPWLVKYGPATTVNYQHGVMHNATTQSALMPTIEQRRGDFSQSSRVIRDPHTGLPFTANVIPEGRISPQARALLRYYPSPNGEMERGGNFQAPLLTETTQDSVQLSMSESLNFRTSVGGTIGYQRSVTDSRNLFDFADTSRQSTLNATLNLSQRISNRMQFSVRYQLSRSSSTVTPFFANRTNVSGDAGITGNSQDPANWGPPTLSFPDIADLRDGDYQRMVKTAHTGSVETQLRRGRHNLKIGGDLRWNQVEVQSQPDPRGTLSFTGAASGIAFADFLLGVPTTSSIAFGETGASLRAAAMDAYVEDDFRVGAGLTMNVGVRWEFEAPYTEKDGRLVNLGVAPGFGAASPVVGNSLLRPDRLGIQPRVAVSWRPVLGSSLVLRGSYGLYRNLGVYQPLGIILAQQPPFSRTVNVQNSPITPLTLANPFPSSVASANTFAVDPDFRAGFVHTWQASAQRDLPASLTVIAVYFGDKGTHLMQAFLPNTYPAGGANPCVSCPTGFTYVTSNGTSIRHAGQFTIRRRLHAGFTATAQYTLAKSTDDAATFSNTSVRPSSLAVAQDWLNLGAERGPSSFDQRHLLSLQVQYTTGVGVAGGTLVDGVWGSIYKDWTVTGQLTAGSGLPLTPVAFLAVPGTGTVGVRPARTGIPPAPVVAGSYANGEAFTAPLPGTWGNAGRNSIRGPSQFALDASIARVFRLRGRVNLEWRIAATNVLNRVTFVTINTVITSPQFGLPTSANAMRRIQTTFRVRF